MEKLYKFIRFFFICQIFFNFCHLRIKSAHFSMDLNFKSAHLIFECFELSIEGKMSPKKSASKNLLDL
jgi:hypothetical protein